MVPNPGRIVEGDITYNFRSPASSPHSPSDQVNEVNITEQHPRSRMMREIRGNEIAMIFQEPMTSLDPLYTIGNHLLEAIKLHQTVDKREAYERAIDTLERVQLPEPARIFKSYPHQLSGGMRQRVMIAIALSCNPSLLIADEPTTALDVTTQAQILELMQRLQEETGMSIIFITHDLGVVAEMCDEVAIMYLGKIVEKTDVDSAYYAPKHPYTQALLRSIPKLEEETHGRLQVIHGSVPDPSARPAGCPFHPRCPEFMPGRCDQEVPTLTTLDHDTEVRCLLYENAPQSSDAPVMAGGTR